MTQYAPWQRFRDSNGTVVDRNLYSLDEVLSPQLRNRRSLWVRLPPGTSKRKLSTCPIVYGQDGQNLFHDATSHSGSWKALEALDLLACEGTPIVMVGVANVGRSRFAEYSPLISRKPNQPSAEKSLDFLIDTVVPLVESQFSIRATPETRTVLGSSLGGLFSLYAYFERPEVFGNCAALSPSLQVASQRFFSFVERSDRSAGRIYLDVGTREVSSPRPHFNSRHYSANATRLRDLLKRKGYRLDESLEFQRIARAVHHESAWAERLPRALRFVTQGR